jgi:hypothetical protein
VWRWFGLDAGVRVGPTRAQLRKGTLTKKQLWVLVFDMPRLLQRDKKLLMPPDATPEEHAQVWKLEGDDIHGRMVEGGWASTGSIFTDGVAISVPRMRLRGEGELLGSTP